MGKRNKIKDPNRFGMGKTLAWTGRGVSLGVSFVILGQLTFFCTNYLGLSPATVGMVLLASRLFDGFTDLVAGVIIDKTHGKLGKARPYELSIIGVWVCTVIMFACPDIGNTGKIIWIFMAYTFVQGVFATLLNASETVYICRAIKNDDDKVKVNSVNGIFITLVCAVVSIIFPILMATMGTTREGWLPMILIFAVPLALIGCLRFIFVPEVIKEDFEKTEPLKAVDFLNALKSNHYIWLLFAAGLLTQLIQGIVMAVGTYYFIYVVGDLKMLSTVGILSLIGPSLLIVFPFILKKISVSRLAAYTCILGVIGSAIKAIAGANIPLLLIGNFMALVAVLPISYYATLMVIYIMDYHELKTGKRVESVFGAIYGLASKVGLGLSSVLVGFLMGAAGFVGTAASQTDSAIKSIIALYGWVPAILFALTAIAMFMFTLEKHIPEIRIKLEEKRN